MALMFPRLARNFAKNGYFPTDEPTIERILALTKADKGRINIIDPCAGEGVALAEAAHHLGREQVTAYAVEYNHERAEHARSLLDHCLYSDLMDTMISRQSFGLLWLNPPYGDMTSDAAGVSAYEGTGRKRLEKLFYQRTLPLLQYGGTLVFIIPHYVLDAELSTWLSNHFTDLEIFEAVDKAFKQVVILGKRIRSTERGSSASQKSIRERFTAIGSGTLQADELPVPGASTLCYSVPASPKTVEHFYRISMEPEQFQSEIQRVNGLWSQFGSYFADSGSLPQRQPVRPLSDWHLALTLAAGSISGVLRSSSGKCLVLKGNTHKEKVRKVEHTMDDDGNVTEVLTDIDKFVPVIKAWDMTPGSPTFGTTITISDRPASADSDPTVEAMDEPGRFELGKLVMTPGISELIEDGLNIMPLVKRHAHGDWGDLSQEDWALNQEALADGYSRLFSSYTIEQGSESRIWIITEADRSSTTILLPSEY